MATVEFIKKRIAGKEAEIERLQKKLERIIKAEETNWENNPYFYTESDKVYTQRDIESATKKLDYYRDQLFKEEEKEASRNVVPILIFLEGWKMKAKGYYMSGLVDYFRDRDEIRYIQNQVARLEQVSGNQLELDVLTGRLSNLRKSLLEETYGQYTEKKKVRSGKYEYLKDYFNCRSLEEAQDVLDKILQREAIRRYDDLIERTNAIVGRITDVSDLSIGDKGDLNGVVIGTKGKASVQTVGAGGYNIQIFHFRTLVNRIDD